MADVERKTADAKKRPLPSQKRLRKATRERFSRARIAEKAYGRQLKQVGKQVGMIVKGFAPNGVVRNMTDLNNALQKYAELLRPWAAAVSERMTTEVGNRDLTAWKQLAKEMGRSLRSELTMAPIRPVLKTLAAEQVALITSLPTEASKRVHKLVLENMLQSNRAAETAKEIMRSGHVTESRALLIARTETSRTATAITMARAVHAGSDGYIWRTVGDSDVRDLHRKLEGKLIKWNDPPIAGEKGERAHAGAIFNCRCIPEPILPDVV